MRHIGTKTIIKLLLDCVQVIDNYISLLIFFNRRLLAFGFSAATAFVTPALDRSAV